MIKCNQQINYLGKTKKENRFFKKAQHIYRKTGVEGFYRGFWATVNRDLISTGVYFYFYYSIKDYLKIKYKEDEMSSFLEGLLGASTGLVTWIFSYPFDTIKTIVQTASLKDKTPTQLLVLKQLRDQGGIKQVYRGASPSLLLSTLTSSLTFLFFEMCKSILFE